MNKNSPHLEIQIETIGMVKILRLRHRVERSQIALILDNVDKIYSKRSWDNYYDSMENLKTLAYLKGYAEALMVSEMQTTEQIEKFCELLESILKNPQQLNSFPSTDSVE